MTTNADDLVQRLRASSAIRVSIGDEFGVVLRAAADEIERLRAEAPVSKSQVKRIAAQSEGEWRTRAETAERELAALRERIASLQSAIEKAPSVDGARMTYIEQDRVLDQLYELSREGHRVRLVRED